MLKNSTTGGSELANAASPSRASALGAKYGLLSSSAAFTRNADREEADTFKCGTPTSSIQAPLQRGKPKNWNGVAKPRAPAPSPSPKVKTVLDTSFSCNAK